jgi:hypothetical protein
MSDRSIESPCSHEHKAASLTLQIRPELTTDSRYPSALDLNVKVLVHHRAPPPKMALGVRYQPSALQNTASPLYQLAREMCQETDVITVCTYIYFWS